MSVSCPVCKAENSTPPNCRRCKADLSMIFALEQNKARLVAQALKALEEKRWQEAQEWARQARALSEEEEIEKLLALTSLLCGDFHQAWRSYGAVETNRQRQNGAADR